MSSNEFEIVIWNPEERKDEIPPWRRECPNCYNMQMIPGHKPATKACIVAEPLKMVEFHLPVEGDRPRRFLVCGQWKDCGLAILGIGKELI